MRMVFWGLAGLILGGAAAVALAVLAAMVAEISQAEGAYAMAVAFFWAPLGAVIGLITGVIVGRRRR
jgi:hypothetical protein